MSLVAVDLTKVYGGLRAVDGFSIRIDPGEIVGLIGPNGAGKTTSFDLLTGQTRPTSGAVTLDGRDITGRPPWELAAMGVARTFQHAASFQSLSALENLMIALAARNVVPRRHRRERALAVLASLAPDAPTSGAVRDLAYGIQRRVGIAIALANEPQYILLDEPAAGLNPAESAALGEAIKSIAEGGVGVLLVEHDLELVGRVVARVEVLSAGRLLYSGRPEDAMREPAVLEAYIGRGKGKNA